MRSLLSFLFVLVLAWAGAQPFEHVWTERFGTPNNGEKLWRLAVDENGNVYAAGNFSGTFSEQGISVTSVGGSDILLLKYDNHGQLLWARSAGGPLDDVAFGVESDKDGNVYITGGYTGFAVFGDTALFVPGQGVTDLVISFVARYSPLGELRWVRGAESAVPANSTTSCLTYAIKLDRSGDLVLAGGYSCADASEDDPTLSSLSFGGQPFRTTRFAGQPHVYAQKMDTLGNTIWLHSVGDLSFAPNDASEGFGTLNSVDIDASNNVWLGGDCGANSTFNSGPVNLVSGPFQALVYQLSPAGEPLSGFVLPSSAESYVEDMVLAENGDLLLGGYYAGTLNGGPPAQGVDGYILRSSPLGTISWTQRIAGPQNDLVSGVSIAPDGHVVIGCYYFYQADLAGIPLATSPGNNSAVVRFDGLGNVIEVIQPEVLSGYSFISDVQSDIFNTIFVCGDLGGEVVFTNDTVVCLTQDTYVSKIAEQLTTGLESGAFARPGPVLWPNPASERFFLEYTGGERAQLELWDATGRLIGSQVLVPGVNAVEVGALPGGLYRAVLVSAAGRTARSVMVLR